MLSFNNFALGSALVIIAGERLGEGWDSFPTFAFTFGYNNLAEETEDRVDMEEMLELPKQRFK